jgi:hypothetical protein
MTAMTPAVELAPSIRAALASVRRRIRVYVWLEGLSLAVLWLGGAFWFSLALDYFPVLVWASEMPRAARGVLLAAIVIGGLYILNKYLFSRAFVPLADRSLAVLLERRYGEFHDSLVTAVELADGHHDTSTYSREMLQHTREDADIHAHRVRTAEVFNYRPLILKVLLALGMVASLAGFYAGNTPAFEIARDRLLLLHDIPWPRSAEIEVVSLELQRAAASEETAAETQVLDWGESRELKVARGASALLRVRASAKKLLPGTCRILYRTGDGDRGEAPMKKIGRVKDGYQYYTFDGKPFKGMLADLSFDVMGYDHRVRGYKIEVVDAPVIVQTELACEFPEYMVDEKLSQWLPRTENLTPATQLPIGTQVTIACRANKDLQSIEVRDLETGEVLSTPGAVTSNSPDRVTLPTITLTRNLTLGITLLDTDGVMSDRPQRIFVAAIKDEVPRVAATLSGISSMVTPDVTIPVVGKIEDDYGLAQSWFDLQVNDAQPARFPFALPADGKIEQQLDFRELRSAGQQTLKPQDKFTLVVVGQDKHNLAGGANTGYGDRWELLVVTPDELLTSLEARELGLRRRYEQIISEMTETRDELLRAAAESKRSPPASSADDAPDAAEGEPADTVKTEDGISVSLRLLIAQRAIQQSQKSAQEVRGVSASFADIRQELINNRVDTAERKERLKEQIADPLAKIVDERFPELDRRLERMAADVDDAAAVQLAVDEANTLLLALDAVLQRMLDLETYNELVDLVRSLIEEQEQVLGETKKKQAADLFK